ncbi:hypothetical protein HBB16_01860 [Pseudonocardia sp. MCCB 268]|nr:hypothetical protein [Pseudonocardia cytotoxica]
MTGPGSCRTARSSCSPRLGDDQHRRREGARYEEVESALADHPGVGDGRRRASERKARWAPRSSPSSRSRTARPHDEELLARAGKTRPL